MPYPKGLQSLRPGIKFCGRQSKWCSCMMRSELVNRLQAYPMQDRAQAMPCIRLMLVVHLRELPGMLALACVEPAVQGCSPADEEAPCSEQPNRIAAFVLRAEYSTERSMTAARMTPA